MGGDASAGFQDVAGDGEFVGGCADIAKRVMQDEVFEMDEFTIDPERGMRVEEMRALEKALADGERAMRSSRRARATAASEIGRSRYLEQIRWHQGFLFPVIHDSLPA